MARVLVTGGAGFLGSHLVEELLARSHRVVVIDDLFRGKKKHLADCKDDPDFHFIKGDCANMEVLNAAVEWLDGVDLVYHLAAVNGTRWFHERADMVIDVNINTTLAALRLAEKHACRLVFASSPEAIGEAGIQPMPVSSKSVFDDAAQHQRHSYGASKYLGEILLQHAVRTKDLDFRIVRPFNAYGGRCPSTEYGQVISIFMDAAACGKPLKVHGDGKQTRSFTWVGDITEAFLLAGLTDVAIDDGSKLAGAVWNVGWPEETSIAELAELVAETAGVEVLIEPSKGYFGDSQRRCPDISLATRQLGWQPWTTLEAGLRSTWFVINSRING
jgi:nucleoside-diphosphate-sugar epimerase